MRESGVGKPTHLSHLGSQLQSNLYITALHKAVTLSIMVTEQLPKNHPFYLLLT